MPIYTRGVIQRVLDSLQNGNAAGFDGMYPEQLKSCGPTTKCWLASFFSSILCSGWLPSIFKKTNIIAVLKPGKYPNLPQTYRPMALLCLTYKLLGIFVLF